MRIIALSLPLLFSTSAFAQPGEPSTQPSGRPGPASADEWSVTLGLAPVVSPEWEGSDDVILSVFPDVRINYGDSIFASIPDGIGWNAITNGGWKAGPLAKLRFGRDQDGGGSPFAIFGSSDALIGLGDIDTSAEIGGFVEKRFGTRRQWAGRIETVRGFGGHEGVVADVSLSYQLRSGRAIVNVGPRASFATADFMQVYFGIDANQSLASGLARYNPNDGLVSYGVGGTLIRPIDRRSAITVFSSFKMLGDEAADSPLVRERGRREQFSIGIGYGYRFGL